MVLATLLLGACDHNIALAGPPSGPPPAGAVDLAPGGRDLAYQGSSGDLASVSDFASIGDLGFSRDLISSSDLGLSRDLSGRHCPCIDSSDCDAPSGCVNGVCVAATLPACGGVGMQCCGGFCGSCATGLPCYGSVCPLGP
jgi:hypothetical protein